jgi:outer membrane lipoprotein SlyB
MFAVRSLSTAVGLTTLALVTACSAPPLREDNNVYAPAPVSRPVPVYVEYGRVENIGRVPVASRSTGVGAVLGAVIGGVVGSRFGGGDGQALATGAGVIGGAVAGNAIENLKRRDDEVFRVQVRFDSGSVRDFDFQRIDGLRVGDRVKWEGGQLHLL